MLHVEPLPQMEFKKQCHGVSRAPMHPLELEYVPTGRLAFPFTGNFDPASELDSELFKVTLLPSVLISEKLNVLKIA